MIPKAFFLAIVLAGNGLLAAETAPIEIPVNQLYGKFKLVGKLHVPLGKLITVVGVVAEGPSKGYDGGPNLRVQRIEGLATQEDIQIAVIPFFGKFGDELSPGNVLPKMENGHTYEIECYESGGFIGVPNGVLQRAGIIIQTSGHYFRTCLEIYKGKEIEPIHFTPSDFKDSVAILRGIARDDAGRAVMQGDKWKIVVNPKAPWPADIVGKSIETIGKYAPSADGKSFSLESGTWHLQKLEDQIGRTVELRGLAKSLNGEWWFDYQGVELYVENMRELPGWIVDNHWRPMVIRGKLEKVKLPRIDQISLKADRDLKEYFIVRNASWEPVPGLLSPERP